MIYTKAGLKDIEAISSLFLSSFSKRVEKKFNIKLNKKIVKEIIELYFDSGLFMVAKEKNKLIGYILAVNRLYFLFFNLFRLKRIHKSFLFFFYPRCLFIFPPSFLHLFRSHIVTLAVNKKYQKKKIALNLVKKIFLELKNQNVRLVYFQIPGNDKKFVNKFLEYKCEIVKKLDNWLIMKRSLLQKI